MAKLIYKLLFIFPFISFSTLFSQNFEINVESPVGIYNCSQSNYDISMVNNGNFNIDTLLVCLIKHGTFELDTGSLYSTGFVVSNYNNPDSIYFNITNLNQGDSLFINFNCYSNLSVNGFDTSFNILPFKLEYEILNNVISFYPDSIAINRNGHRDISHESNLDSLLSSTWGVSWIDFDNDGWEDVFVTNYWFFAPNKMFKNMGNGTFQEVNLGVLTSDMGNSISSTWGDFNNDGWEDVFVSNNMGTENTLYENIGGITFQKVNVGNVNNFDGNCHNGLWLDIENDGNLDLFVTDYSPDKPNRIFHNYGNGVFIDETPATLLNDSVRSIGATACDFDNDGDMDIFVPCTHGKNNMLLVNDGNGSFFKDTTNIVTQALTYSVGASWGDIDNDLDMDLFVTNTSSDKNFLYRNIGYGSFELVNAPPFNTDIGHASGSSFYDVDNDGDLDLFVAHDTLGDISKLYINKGDGTFYADSTLLTTRLGYTYPCATADYDNDGDQDIYIGNINGDFDKLIENNLENCNNWICFHLEGISSNRSAIGAKVKIKANISGVPVWQMREVLSQTGGGAGSQNTLRAYFGIGDATHVDFVIIEWPSSSYQIVLNPIINNCNTIIEEATGAMVSGRCLYDNGNCVEDTTDVPMENLKLLVLPDSIIVQTNYLGEYSIYLSSGSYSIQPLLIDNWFTCSDSILNLNITAGISVGNNFLNSYHIDSVNYNICNSDTFYIDNNEIYQSGTYQFYHNSFYNIDSLYIVNVSFNNSEIYYKDTNLCNSDTLFMENDTIYSPGNYTYNYTTQYDCDSIIELLVTEKLMYKPIIFNLKNVLYTDSIYDFYNWFLCNSNSEDSTIYLNGHKMFFIPDYPGSYGLEVYRYGCKDSSDCLYFDFENEYFQVYPNPFTDEFNVNLGNFYEKVRIELFSIDGKLIFDKSFQNKSIVKVDGINYSYSIYMMRITYGNTLDEVRIIKILNYP